MLRTTIINNSLTNINQAIAVIYFALSMTMHIMRCYFTRFFSIPRKYVFRSSDYSRFFANSTKKTNDD